MHRRANPIKAQQVRLQDEGPPIGQRMVAEAQYSRPPNGMVLTLCRFFLCCPFPGAVSWVRCGVPREEPFSLLGASTCVTTPLLSFFLSFWYVSRLLCTISTTLIEKEKCELVLAGWTGFRHFFLGEKRSLGLAALFWCCTTLFAEFEAVLRAPAQESFKYQPWRCRPPDYGGRAQRV